jgi:hypothetical protein
MSFPGWDVRTNLLQMTRSSCHDPLGRRIRERQIGVRRNLSGARRNALRKEKRLIMSRTIEAITKHRGVPSDKEENQTIGGKSKIRWRSRSNGSKPAGWRQARRDRENH